MKAQHYRTTNQANSGRTASTNRRRANSASGAASRSRKAPRRTGKPTSRQGNGARVIMLLVGIGSIIAVGFILAQHSLINVWQLKRAEESLKSELDTLSSQQRYYTFKKEQALSTQESDRAANESGLIQPGLGGAVAQPAKLETEVKKPAKVENHSKALSSGLVAKVPDKRTAAAKQPLKAVKAIKVTSKTTPTAKPDKTRKDSKQMAKNQKPQKDVKRQR